LRHPIVVGIGGEVQPYGFRDSFEGRRRSGARQGRRTRVAEVVGLGGG